MARTSVMAAGGIVLRPVKPPLIAVVRLRKRNEWVLPKGKLDDGETPREAAEREVNEETGHDVLVHEFLGTLVYESGGRSKVVHYWRMQADGDQVYELMTDIREVDWLPLELALTRLSRSYERAFLENVGPLAVDAALADLERRKQAAAKKRRSRAPASVQPSPAEAPIELAPPAAETPLIAGEIVNTAPVTETAEPPPLDQPEFIHAAEPEPPPAEPEPVTNPPESRSMGRRRKTLGQLLREWLNRAA